MQIFIGNLDHNVTETQLHEFFKGFDKQASFKIINLKEEKTGEVFTYGLVTIESDRLAKKAIKKLNYKKMNGHPVTVREFFHRASQNDNRALNWRLKDWMKEERRGNDRRTSRKLQKNLDEYEVDGIGSFSRKYD